MQVNGPTNSSPVCVTIDEVYGERPGPCHEDATAAKSSESKETTRSPDYFDDVIEHYLITEL